MATEARRKQDSSSCSYLDDIVENIHHKQTEYNSLSPADREYVDIRLEHRMNTLAYYIISTIIDRNVIEQDHTVDDRSKDSNWYRKFIKENYSYMADAAKNMPYGQLTLSFNRIRDFETELEPHMHPTPTFNRVRNLLAVLKYYKDILYCEILDRKCNKKFGSE